ncbi:hypothetical protein [Pseudoxanthomonas wuyuanensis]|uniref:Uncharacterized protein n=1 Tax=Pseudoxanthomonas wuyuanensis TaxID=1073196 RepID=A0A286DGB1_9GAMM|nr:hypothetical protein [Pseudoxanthomonas wuyuanensis]KAF1719682.1 hypothetical protein CSC75_14370 [Pseudoxanthomonas wuyuanensis]SOD57626.1 hypothetical protein SAMN06296416_11512 [Pseudoxanthomonas wuyuanensis]
MNHPQNPDPRSLEAIINVEVDVWRVKDSPDLVGNTPTGHYKFILDRDVVHVDAPGVPTRINYRLTKDAIARGFSFTAAFTNDYKFQLRGPYLEGSTPGAAGEDRYDTIWFLHSNTHASLISVSLQVRDSQVPDRTVAYDPQITNTPGD